MSHGVNLNPIVHLKSKELSSGEEAAKQKRLQESKEAADDEAAEEIDSLEVFDLLRHINDPEHPLTLEQLNVAQLDNVFVDNKHNTVKCSMATLIGLSLRVKLLRSLPRRFKVDIRITPGTHATEDAINKQLNDKERVAAALENAGLLEVVNKAIAHTDPAVEVKW